MRLETKRLILRDLEDKDVKELLLLVNDLDVSQYLAIVPHPYSLKDAKWFVNHCKEESKKKPRESYELGIELKDKEKIIGIVSITKVDLWDKKATLGYWLGKQYWKNGIMTEAVRKLIEFAFDELKLQRIDVNASTKNKASNSLIKKLGFKYEGMRKRNHRAKSTGKYHDANIYGLLKEDWKKKK